MKTTIVLGIGIVSMLYIADVSISFNPFKFQMKKWLDLIGYILLMASLVCFGISNYERGIKKGREEIIKIIKEVSKEEKK